MSRNLQPGPAGRDEAMTSLDESEQTIMSQQQELALRESEAQFAAVFQASPDTILITRLSDGLILEANPQFIQMSGYPRSEAIGRTTLELQLWADPQERDLILTHLHQSSLLQNFEATFRRKSGEVFVGLLSCQVIDRGGQACVLSMIRDISDRKQAEMSLRESEIRYRRIVETANEGIWIIDTDNKTRFVNPKMAEMLGYPAEDMIGKSLFEFMDASGITLARQQLERRRQGVAEKHDFKFQHKNGADVWTVISTNPIFDEAGHYIGALGMLTDISDRKAAEMALQHQAERERMLHDVVKAIRSSLDLNDIFTISAARIAEFLQTEVSIVQYLPEQGCWRHRVMHNQVEGLVTSMRQDIPDERNPFAAQLKQLQVVAIDGSTSIPDPINRALSQQFPGSRLLVPISVNGSIWGSLTLARPYQTNTWQPEEIELAQRVADQLAIAIYQAHLYQQLQASEAKLNAILNTSPVVIVSAHVFANRTCVYDYFSAGCEAILGYPAAELMQHPGLWQERVHPDDWAIYQAQAFDAILAAASWQFEYRFQQQDGSWHWLMLSITSQWQDAIQGWQVTQVHVDINDRKVTEAALRKREQEFRTLAENSPDSILRCDRQFRFLYTNPTVSKLSGIPGAAFLGKTSEELGFPASLVALWHYGIKRVFATQQDYALEYDLDLGIGYRYFYSRIVPEVTAQGTVESVLVVSRDITDLKQAQTALMQQAEREYTLRLITQHMRETLELEVILSTAVAEVHRILETDRTLIFQLSSDHSGVVIQEAVRPEYPVTLEMHWEDECFPVECYQAYSLGQARIVSDVALDSWGHCLVDFMAQTAVKSKMVAPITQRQRDGSMKVWGLLITHACGVPRQWQEDELDLLQQVATQLAIAIEQAELYSQVQQLNINLEQQVHDRTIDLQQALEFEMLLKRITDQVRDSLEEDQILETVVRELGQVLQLECCDTGIYNADLTTSTIAHEFTKTLTSAKGMTFAINEATHAAIYPVLFQGKSLQFCTQTPSRVRPDQQRLSILACPIMDDQRVLGDLWLYKQEPCSPSEVRLVQQVANQCAIALRQSRLYQAAQAQVRELERLNHLKDDFLSSVSHELRTPISNVKMAVEMLEISLEPTAVLTDPAQLANRYFQILKTECQREIELINDLLDLTHLEAGTEPLELTPTDLRFLIPHIAEPFFERTRQQQQSLELNIPDDLPLVMLDLSYLERIVIELLNNACKYTPAGEQIQVSIQTLADRLRCVISNSGVEIDATECNRIFDKFYRIPNHDPWKHGGTGLGLALVKKLTEQLGGNIQVKSGDRQTAFILEFGLSSNCEQPHCSGSSLGWGAGEAKPPHPPLS